MLYIILGIIVFIVVLSIIVILHEGGHFLFAKKAGILCHEFSVGMGPLIAQKKHGETMYSIRAIPLGGYVSMAGEEAEQDILKGFEKIKIEKNENDVVTKIILILNNPKYTNLPQYSVGAYDLVGTAEAKEDELFIELTDELGVQNRYTVARDCMVNYVKKEEIQIAPYDRNFCNKPLGARFMSVFAGPLMNFVLALIVFFFMGIIFGYADTSTTEVGEVSGPALEVGLEDGDIIYSINDSAAFTDWDSFSDYMDEEIASGKGITSDGYITIEYLHDGEKIGPVQIQPLVYAYCMDAQIAYSTDKGVYVVDIENYSDSKIASSGILGNDSITAIDGTEINGIDDFLKFFTTLDKNATSVDVAINHEGTSSVKTVSLYTVDDLSTQSINRTDVLIGVSSTTKFNFGKLMYMPWVQTGQAATQVILTLKQLFRKNSGIKITSLSGPVGIGKLFVNLVKSDEAFQNVLSWMGVISVNIGIINLLPLPALDGGRLAFLIYEAITKKKATPKVENTIHNIGFILLLILFGFILISDVIKLF